MNGVFPVQVSLLNSHGVRLGEGGGGGGGGRDGVGLGSTESTRKKPGLGKVKMYSK